MSINYFEAAEKTLRARGSLEKAVVNLERRRERIISHSSPAGYPSPDLTKSYTCLLYTSRLAFSAPGL